MLPLVNRLWTSSRTWSYSSLSVLRTVKVYELDYIKLILWELTKELVVIDVGVYIIKVRIIGKILNSFSLIWSDSDLKNTQRQVIPLSLSMACHFQCISNFVILSSLFFSKESKFLKLSYLPSNEGVIERIGVRRDEAPPPVNMQTHWLKNNR